MSLAGLRGLCPDALESSRFKVQGQSDPGSMTKFSDLKVQSDPRVDDKVINDYEL